MQKLILTITLILSCLLPIQTALQASYCTPVENKVEQVITEGYYHGYTYTGEAVRILVNRILSIYDVAPFTADTVFIMIKPDIDSIGLIFSENNCLTEGVTIPITEFNSIVFQSGIDRIIQGGI